MSRGTRAALYLFLAAMSLLIGSIAVVIALPPISLLWTFGNFLPTGIYASFILVVAIATPLLCLVAAFGALLFGKDP